MEEKKHAKIIDNNEIDLAELFGVVLRGWKIVLSVVVLFAIAGLGYGFLKTPIFQSKTRVIVADSASLAALNQYSNYNISPDYAYYRFTEKVSSYHNFLEFVKETSPDLGEVEDLSTLFAESFSFSGNAEDDNKALSGYYSYPEPVQGAEILNEYVSWTAEHVRSELIYYFVQSNDLRIDELKTRRNLIKKKMVEARQARIFDLERAIQTASALDIKKPTSPQELDRQQRLDNKSLYADIQNNSWQLPLYFMGTEVLNAEKATLNERLEEGLSSTEVRDLSQEITERQNTSGRYTAILNANEKEKLAGIQVVNVVDTAYRPTQPIKPNKKMILFMAVFMGGLVGVLTVFVRRSMSINKIK